MQWQLPILVTLLLPAICHAESCAEYAEKIGIPREPATGEVMYQEVVALDDLSAKQIYSRATAAIVTVQNKDAMQLDDKENGRIIAKGIFLVAAIPGLPASPSNDLPVYYTMTMEIKNGRYRLTVSDLLVYLPTERTRYPLQAFINQPGEDSCSGLGRTVPEQVHRNVMGLIGAVKGEMTKTSPAGGADW